MNWGASPRQTKVNGMCFDDREATVAIHNYLPVGGGGGPVARSFHTRLVARAGRSRRGCQTHVANLRRCSRPPQETATCLRAAGTSTAASSRIMQLQEVGQTDASCGVRQLAEVKITSARKPVGHRCAGRPRRGCQTRVAILRSVHDRRAQAIRDSSLRLSPPPQ